MTQSFDVIVIGAGVCVGMGCVIHACGGGDVIDSGSAEVPGAVVLVHRDSVSQGEVV